MSYVNRNLKSKSYIKILYQNPISTYINAKAYILYQYQNPKLKPKSYLNQILKRNRNGILLKS